MWSFYVDINNGDLILVTNRVEKEFFGNNVLLPFEGLVFILSSNKIVTWSLQNIEGRNLVQLPDNLKLIFTRQYHDAWSIQLAQLAKKR